MMLQNNFYQHLGHLGNEAYKKDWVTSHQGMTYFIKFIILYEDYLVMKIIGNRPVTEADTDFSKISNKN